MVDSLLSVDGLTIDFLSREGAVRAVDGVSFNLRAGETLGIVGESGCGKSVTALSILRLLPRETSRIGAGRIVFDGEDLAAASERRLRQIRGNAISMIFQEPMVSLNPVMTIGDQLREVVVAHGRVPARDARRRCRELLDLVRISDGERRLNQYPHELSGGMRQRVMIAIALACDPKILIADEPTTALDVTVQAQILALIWNLQKSLGTAVMFISHDLRVIADIASRVVVMYAGRIVEEAPTAEIFARPLHPYTIGLLGAVPRLDAPVPDRLVEIPGTVPSPGERRAGCAFASRCDRRIERCRHEAPVLTSKAAGHRAACWVVADAS